MIVKTKPRQLQMVQVLNGLVSLLTYGTSVVMYNLGLLGMITTCLSWLSPKCVLASKLQDTKKVIRNSRSIKSFSNTTEHYDCLINQRENLSSPASTYPDSVHESVWLLKETTIECLILLKLNLVYLKLVIHNTLLNGLDNGIWSYHLFLPIYATLHISLRINLIWGMQLLLQAVYHLKVKAMSIICQV